MMMTGTEKILDKVRKLLALSRDTPYPAEAETALAAAQRLMLEHGLSLEETDQGDEPDKFDQDEIVTGSRQPPEAVFVWDLVDRYFFCTPIYGRTDGGQARILLVGRREHLPIARYVGVFLSRTFRALWSAYRAERRRPLRDRRPYYDGLRLGIATRIEQERRRVLNERPQLGALIQTRERALALEIGRRIGPVVQRSIAPVAQTSAHWDGYERGKRIQIRDPLPSPTSQQRISREGN